MQAYVFVTTTNPGPRRLSGDQTPTGGDPGGCPLRGAPVVALLDGDDLGTLDRIVDTNVDLPTVPETSTHIVWPIEG